MSNSHGKGISLRYEFNGFNPYGGISEFDGKLRDEEFLDWLYLVDKIFKYFDTLEHRRVRMVASKLRKHVSIWWKNLDKLKEIEEKDRIRT